MGAIQGRLAELWTISGAGSAITKQACEAVGSSTTVFHVTDPTKRYLSPETTILVYCGGGETLQTSGYHIAGGCQIHFDAEPSAPVKLTGAYLAPAEVTLVQGWNFAVSSEVFEVTSLGDTARSYQGAGLTNWTGSFERFFEDATWEAKAVAGATKLVIRMFTDQPSGYCWTGWIAPNNWSQNLALDALERETFSFTGDGEVVYGTDET